MREENSSNRPWVKYLVTAVSGLIGAVILCWVKGAFRATETKEIILIVCDAFTLVGVILTCFGLLTILNKAGAFDGLAYTFKSTLRVWRNYQDDKTPKTYYDYKKTASEKRTRKWHLIIVGAGYLVIAIVLAVVHGSIA